MPHIEIKDVSLVYDTPAGQVVGVERTSFDIEPVSYTHLTLPTICSV